MRKEVFDYCLTYSNMHKNIYQKVDNYYIGYTNKGEEFYIDEEDFSLVSKYMWRINKGRVVTTIQGNAKYKQTQLALHNLVLHNYNTELIPHHINGLKTDCRKMNLKIIDVNEIRSNNLRKNKKQREVQQLTDLEKENIKNDMEKLLKKYNITKNGLFRAIGWK